MTPKSEESQIWPQRSKVKHYNSVELKSGAVVR